MEGWLPTSLQAAPNTVYIYSMLVEVVELWWQGKKLSREARKQLKPVRGELTVERRWTHQDIEWAPLYADIRPYQLETLCQVKLRYWKGRNVVLSGVQRGPDAERKKGETQYEQWWWCRILS